MLKTFPPLSARLLSLNLFRCSARVSCAPAASARVTGAELRDYGEGVHHEEADPAVGVEREGSSNSGDRQSGKKGIEMVQAAREAVLRQNQKVCTCAIIIWGHYLMSNITCASWWYDTKHCRNSLQMIPICSHVPVAIFRR